MSRSKKSRKPGVGSSGVIKTDKKQPAVISPKKPKKQTGKKPGNRQQEAVKTVDLSKKSARKVDPRIGSKKPILLTPSNNKQSPVNTQKVPVSQSATVNAIPTVKPLTNTSVLFAELDAIEDDTLLQNILAKQENDHPLSADEVDYYNEKMTRYQALQALLGIADDEPSDDNQPTVKETRIDSDIDDDSLWDKLDNNNLSSFD